MVVTSALKSITNALNVFHCFFVRYYSGFVNNIFYKALVVQGKRVVRLAITSWCVINVVFFFIGDVI